MAEETDQREKTEEPTPKKLEDARRKGDLPTSREVNHWFLVLAAAVALMMFVPDMFRRLGRAFAYVVAESASADPNGASVGPLLVKLVGETAAALAPTMLVFVIAALGAGLIQNGFVFTAETIVPKLEKISVLRGVKRQFSARALVEFTKGVLKIAVVGTVATLVLAPSVPLLDTTVTFAMPEVLALLQSLSLRILIAVLAVMTVITVLDVLYQRHEYLKKLRMSRQEIKEEMKQTEGDPHVRSRLRQIRMERARRRMMAKVPEADVVITNPQHYSVALEYDGKTMAAPRVVAKGVDAVALRIREVAREHDVPIVENPPLARALYAAVDLDQEVPPEHYRAVAEVIGYVMNLARRGARR